MKILSGKQVREADAYTIKNEPISSVDLMERAAMACVTWIIDRFTVEHDFKVICGTGNNGGDGLAIARLLLARGYSVEVLVLNYNGNRSDDFLQNYSKLKSLFKNKSIVEEIHSIESFQTALKISKKTILVDALFGSGLNKPLNGMLADAVRCINELTNTVIAIDIPSGLYADELNSPDDSIVVADYTLSFQFPKFSFMLPEAVDYVGHLFILDIGLHLDYIQEVSTQHYFITERDVASILKKRAIRSHKGNFGHSLLIAGSYGKMGAAVISAKACLRSGVGLLTVHVPKCGYEIMQTTLPEAMVTIDKEYSGISEFSSILQYNAIGVGPGIGTSKQSESVLHYLIQNTKRPMVLDADALNILSENKGWLPLLPPNTILTPHLKEFERLVGRCQDSLERLKLQREFSVKYTVYIVLKGVHTSISCPDGSIYFNSTGNPGMAKGGSGDALTGVLTALLAQQYSAEQSCLLGVYLHGLAGDFAALHFSEESMLVTDLIDQLGNAFNAIKRGLD